MALSAATAALAALPAVAENWPQWRGPGRDCVTDESSGYPSAWPPERLWRMDVGDGASSPVLAEGRVYVTGWRKTEDGPGEDVVRCLDAVTGEELWSRAYPSPRYGRHANAHKNHYGGPNATPAWDAATGLLVTVGVDGDFRCWDTKQQGSPLWARNLYDDYNVPPHPNVGRGARDYSWCSSPLIRDGEVILDVGGPAGLVMGFDITTGRVNWRSESTAHAGSNSGPMLMRIAGRDSEYLKQHQA
jgi:outer membrane protein assembly factor BamB